VLDSDGAQVGRELVLGLGEFGGELCVSARRGADLPLSVRERRLGLARLLLSLAHLILSLREQARVLLCILRVDLDHGF
jgi:hypothetical protein